MINNNVPVTKPNDWFVVNFLNPKATFEDFYQMAVQPSNTVLKERSFYMEEPQVKKIFSENPEKKFDQAAFNMYYDGLVQRYNDFEQENYQIKDLTQNLYYSAYDFTAPLNAKREKTKVQIGKIFNPDAQKVGTIQPELWAQSEFSIREIAQTQEVKNQRGENLGFTPNDDSKSGLADFWFDKMFKTKDALALAQWTEDGMHSDEFSGMDMVHKKGEYKLNELGKYYYETLEGKTPLNRTLLSPWDTITDDGSWQNKYDFMDSDSKTKSVGATILKSVATITPYFIPGVGQYYALFTAAQAQQEFLPQIGTMVGRFVSGAEFDQSDLYKRLNTIQAFGTTMTMTSVSDSSMQKMWTWENLFTLVPEIFVQLKQQNVLAKIPKWISGTNADAKQLNAIAKTIDSEKLAEARKLWKQSLNIANPEQQAVMKRLALLHTGDQSLLDLYEGWVKLENKIAKGLALGYMTAASAGDIDNTIEKFGIQGRDAAWMKLGVLAAFWLSMSTWSLGDWQVDYAATLKDGTKEINRLLQAKGLEIQKNLDDAGVKLTTAQPKAGASATEEAVTRVLTPMQQNLNRIKSMSGSQIFKEGWQLGKEIMGKVDANAISRSMVKESIEEMSEETFTDGAKIVYNLFSDLNLTETKDRKVNWDDDDILSRFAMAGIGGALGGFLFQANESFLRPIKNGAFDKQLSDISVDMIRNNKVEELYEMIEKIRTSDKGFASKNLSFSIYNKLIDVNGQKINFEPSSKDKLSQNDVIANVLKSQLQFLEKQIFNAKVPSTQQAQDVFSQRTGSLLELKMHTAIEDDIKHLSNQFIELYSSLEELSSKDKLDPAQEKRQSALFLELQTKQKEIEEITLEESIGKYYGEAMFNLDKHLNATYTSVIDEDDAAQAMYGKSYQALNEVEAGNINAAIEKSSSREALRIKKRLFDLQQKFFNTSIFTVNEQLTLRKDILPMLSQIEFDYEINNNGELDTEISNLIPQYGKNYLQDFLNSLELTEQDVLQNDKRVTNAESFYQNVMTLVQKQSTNPETLTNDEFLLLKYLKKQLEQLNPHLDKVFDDEFMAYVQKRGFDQDPEMDSNYEDDYDYERFGPEFKFRISDKTLNALLFENINKEGITRHNFNYNPDSEMDMSVGEQHGKLAMEYLESKGGIYITTLKKQLELLSAINSLPDFDKHAALSQLELLIQKFDVQYKSDTKNIINLIDQERNRLLERPLEDYVNNSEITDLEIKKQLEQLSRLKVILYAYTNFSLDPKTQIGYFPALNEYNQKNNIAEVYSQIPQDLNLFITDYINFVENRLTYLQKISEQNQNSKIPNKEKAESVMNTLQVRELLRIVNNVVIPDQPKQLKEILSTKFIDLNNKFFVEESDPKKLEEFLNNLTTKDIETLLETVWSVEIQIYEYFNSLDLETKKTFLREVYKSFSGDISKITQLRTEVINEYFTEYKKQTKSITQTDSLIYTLNTLFSDTKQFVKDYNTFLTTQPIKFALFGDQQNALKLIHGLLQNNFPQQFGLDPQFRISEAIELFEETAKETFSDDNLLQFNFKNILQIYGVQGTGKTDAVLNFVQKILESHNLNAVGLASTRNIQSKLLNSIPSNKVTNVDTQNLEAIFKLIFGSENLDELEKELQKNSAETEVFLIEKIQEKIGQPELANTFKLNENHPLIIKIRQNLTEIQKQDFKLGKDIINLILIDEQTQVNKFKLELLNEYVEIYNKTRPQNKLAVVVTGDWRQQGQYLIVNEADRNGNKTDVKHPNIIQQNLGLRTMDLNSSLRVGNNVKAFNAEELSLLAETYSTKTSESDVKIKLKKSYFGGLYGDFAQDYDNPSQNPRAVLEALKNLKVDSKKIVLVSERNDSNMKALQSEFGIDLIYMDEVNGIEYDYAIINAKSERNIGFDSKKLNTFLTRSKKASFFNKSFLTDSKITLEEIEEKSVFENALKPDKIEAYKQKRIKMINSIQVKLLGQDKVSELPVYEEIEERASDNSGLKFNAGAPGEEIELSGKNLQKAFLELSKQQITKTKDGEEQREVPPSLLSEKLGLFGLVQLNHEFGTKDDNTDPEEIGKETRKLYNPPSHRRNVDLINAISKEIFIKNLYNKAEDEDVLYNKLLLEVRTHIASDIDELDLVFYNRKFDPSFDKRADGKIEQTITVLAVKLQLTNGETYYLPIGGQTDNINEALIKAYPNEFQNGEDIILNRKYIARFLSPNLSLNILSEKQPKIQNLKDAGFVVSPIYVLQNKEFKEAFGNFQKNGQEFVLVSTDQRQTPETLFNTFKTELNQMMVNKFKKTSFSETEINDFMLNAYGLSASSVKLVYLDRIGLEFYSETEKDWLTAISEGRSEKDFLTVRSFADAYVTSNILSTLTKKYIELNTNSYDAQTKKRNDDLLEQEELEFIAFYEEMVKVINVLGSYAENSTELTKQLKGSNKDVLNVLDRIDKNILTIGQADKRNIDPMFTKDHMFVYLMKASIDGGSFKMGSKVISVKQMFDEETKRRIKSFISSTLKSRFPNGIYYTAQIGKGTKDDDFQYIQDKNTDENMFGVSKVIRNNIYLPLQKILDGATTSVTTEKSTTNEPEAQENRMVKILDDHGNLILLALNKIQNLSDDTKKQIMDLYKEIVETNINDGSMSVDIFLELFVRNANQRNFVTDDAKPIVFNLINSTVVEIYTESTVTQEKDQLEQIKLELKEFLENNGLKDQPESVQALLDLFGDDAQFVQTLYMLNLSEEQLEQIINKTTELNQKCSGLEEDSEIPF